MTPKGDNFRTVVADKQVREGRLANAQQFLQVADDARELSGDGVADAAVTLYVHAGIVAADAICARALGAHARGQNHQEAVGLLATVDKGRSTELSVLLGMKTRAGYGHDPISETQLVRAQRAAHALVAEARL